MFIDTESGSAMATTEKPTVRMRWLAACAVAATLAAGILTPTAVASADTATEPDGNSNPQGESETESRTIARKAQWNRAIQQIDKHNVSVSAGTTTRTVTTPKTKINLTRVVIKGNA
jgi:hypothetical protein